MAKFVCLLVLLAVIEYSLALKCYSCGVGTNTCDKLDKNMLTDCAPVVGKDTVCAKIVNKDKVEKRCEGVDKNTKLECHVQGDVTTCYCNADECNAATSINLSYFAAVGLLVAYLVPKVLVH